MKSFFLLILLTLPVIVFGQDENLKYENHVYLDNIKSVKFHVDGLFLSQPVLNLNSSSQLRLAFDDLDMETDVKDYTYFLVHCDRDWKPSNLTDMDYLQGFQGERIEDYRYSFKTVTTFTHYELLLPNEDIQITKSGNYLLKIYDEEDDKMLAITRRFVVVDTKVRIIPKMVRPSRVSKTRTHHEIDFSVDYERFPIRSPQQEIWATVIQNGRWDNAIHDIKPLFLRTNSLLFDYQDKIVFPAGNEFRQLDLRSLRYSSENISVIENYEDRYEVIMFKDEKRAARVFLNNSEINGAYLIETQDQDDFDLSSNYANVLFSLYSPTEYFEKDIYIVGEITDWKLKPDFKMVHNPALNAYVAKPTLKQGYYNYAYAFVSKEDKPGTLNLSEIEGDFYETNNQYTILVYYRPFGERYDQLIGLASFTTTP